MKYKNFGIILIIMFINLILDVECKGGRSGGGRSGGGKSSGGGGRRSSSGSSGGFFGSSRSASISSSNSVSSSKFGSHGSASSKGRYYSNIKSGHRYHGSKSRNHSHAHYGNNNIPMEPQSQIKSHLKYAGIGVAGAAAGAAGTALLYNNLDKFSEPYNDKKRMRELDHNKNNGPDIFANFDSEVSASFDKISSTVAPNYNRSYLLPFYVRPYENTEHEHMANSRIANEINSAINKYNADDNVMRDVVKNANIHGYLLDQLRPKDTEVFEVPSDPIMSNYMKENFGHMHSTPGPHVLPLFIQELMAISSSSHVEFSLICFNIGNIFILLFNKFY